METFSPSSELRALNRRKVLKAIYQNREGSKQGIAQELSLSLPTVTQNLKELEELGLVDRNGLYESTGGRKAHIYHFLPTGRIAIGVLILKELVNILAVNLHGHVQKSQTLPITFVNSSVYLRRLGDEINAFIESLGCNKNQVLGVSIALQGLISADGKYVLYGEILDCTGLTLGEVQASIEYPCGLIHDTEAAAVAELWVQEDLKDAVLLALSRNLGGALIINGAIHRGQELSSGIIEHTRLYPHGRPCYCGKHGCLEAYCSADALMRDAGEPLELFFSKLRLGDVHRQAIWDTYLHNLAIAINNLRMTLDCEYIIGGYLSKFMIETDFTLLEQYVQEECPFVGTALHLSRSIYTEDSAATGAAITLINAFLNSF